MSYQGFLYFNFNGLGANINGKTMTDFVLRVDIGENPHTSNLLMSEALIGKSTTNRAAIQNGNTATFRPLAQSTGNIVAVPLPATTYLLGLEMLMLMLRTKQNHFSR